MPTAVKRPPVAARAPARRAAPRGASTKPRPASAKPRTASTAARPRPRVASTPARPKRGHGRALAIAAIGTVCALVFAVVFHVILAEGQLELDHLSTRIAHAQQIYEKRRLQWA